VTAAVEPEAAAAFAALLGACVWVGGFVALVVVAGVARSRLERPVQVEFFRSLGRRFLVVGPAGLGLALAGGAALLAGRPWDATAAAAVAVAVALVASTLAGVLQARAMTRLRSRGLRRPADRGLAERVRRGAALARVLRAAIGVLSLVLLLLAAVLAT